MKPTWEVAAVGVVRERYTIEADTEDEARVIFESGHAGQPWHSEVDDPEIVRIKRSS
jgi:hypothetical protein